MENHQIRQLIRQELPGLLQQDREMREWVLALTRERYADKGETESRFDRLLAELQRDREEQTRRWEENQRELRAMREEQNSRWEEQDRKWEEQDRRWEKQDRRWEEQDRRWEEQDHKWEENAARQGRILKRLDRFDQSIGALGARWGLHTEQSFRNALRSILEDSFDVKVRNVTEFDDEGEVFGRPDQVELDVIIHNGVLILCEIKSSISKSEMYIFARKVQFYEKRHERKADRMLVISPMVEDRAKPLAKTLGIEVYSHADDVPL
jgi:hypothetical protein